MATVENTGYKRPQQLPHALALLQTEGYHIVAGGTDFYPSLGDKKPTVPVLDISAIKALRSLSVDEHQVEIGALCSWSDIANAELPESLRALQQAAREVGSVQIQNRATIAGNLCNASPAADGVPPLLCCDAVVNLASATGTRSMPLSEFVLGNRRTARLPQELVTSLTIPAAGCKGQSDFLKLGARKYLVISIAMVACRLVVEEGCIAQAAISVGSCSEVAVRLPQVESALTNLCVSDEAAIGAVVKAVPDRLESLSPIDDIRATTGYRLAASARLVRRSLARCLQRSSETAA